jgi:hypothetical protein
LVNDKNLKDTKTVNINFIWIFYYREKYNSQ